MENTTPFDSNTLQFRKALLVEDEPHLATSLLFSLKHFGLEVTHAKDLHEATEHIHLGSSAFDLILLDRMLPDGDGVELCDMLRHQHYEGAILFLSAMGEPSDRVLGLNSGADDYLSKPFSIEELEARLRALSRRIGRKQSPGKSQDQSGWSFEAALLKVKSPHQEVQLTPLEFKLMRFFIESSGEIISRETLLKNVWGYDENTKTRSIDLFIVRMRKFFEADPENPKHILTVRGAGYRFQK